jgi:hypothetical protein
MKFAPSTVTPVAPLYVVELPAGAKPVNVTV